MSPLINTATKIYRGTSLASKVYRGSVQVWPPAAAWGPDQTGFGTAPPTGYGLGSLAVVSVGTDITFTVAGRITGLRFFSHSGDTTSTSRIMRVWSVPGATQLATTTLTYPTSVSAWYSNTLATPVAVTAGQTVRVTLDCSNVPIDHRRMARTTPPASDIVNGDLTVARQSYTIAGEGNYPNTLAGWLYYADVIFQKAL